MDKGKLHHYWIKYRYISLFVPIALIVLSGTTAAFSLRENNLKMLELKDAVIAADANDGDVEKALQDLRAHVNAHMNTRLRPEGSTEPPIQLVNRYEKLVALQQANTNVDATVQRLLQEGQAQCASVAVSLRNQCVKDYFVSNGGSEGFVKLPPKELYTFDFATPNWTPDRAGLSIVVLVLSTLLLVGRIVVGIVIKRQIN